MYNFLYFFSLLIGNYEVRCAVLKYLPNLEIVTTPTQPQHKLNLTQLIWVWHENGPAN